MKKTVIEVIILLIITGIVFPLNLTIRESTIDPGK